MPRRTLLVCLLLLPVASAALAADLEDPTRPAVALPAPAPAGAPPAPAPLALTSVWVSPRGRVAVIDGQRVGVGDRLHGARVVAIELSGVRLRGEGGDVLLTLTGDGVRKSPPAWRSSR